jgi:hypothetical protein
MKAPSLTVIAVSLLVLHLPGAPGAAQSVNPEIVPDFFAAPAESAPPPLRLAEAMVARPETSLRSAEAGARDALDALQTWNRAGHLPFRAGIVRMLPSRTRARLNNPATVQNPAFQSGGALGVSPSGSRVWGLRVDVEGAQRLRLHLTQVALPAGSRLWIYAPGEEPRAFGLELLGPDGDLWTPSVTGDVAFLEAEVPADAADAAGFTVEEVLEGVLPAPTPLKIGECLVDGTCVSNATLGVVADYRKAVGQLDFVIGSFEYLCSGALLSDTDGSTTIPYLLTANHCISTQSTASSLEVFWDYKTAACNGSIPSLGGLPRSNGSTLMATGEGSDFTLLRLASIPSGRALLGWNASAAAVPNGTPIHRLSHPAPFDNQYALPQRYSRGTVRTSGVPICGDAPRPNFLYSQVNQGGTFGGSSGSPVILGNGQVIGQLTGGCGSINPEDGCDYSNSEIDGAFSASYPSLQAFLSPGTNPGTCTPDGDTLCLNNGRFKVEATFTANGQSGNANVVKLTNETGYLWFFGSSNVEAVIKVLNGCGANSRFWVFAGGLTNVRTVITVTDVSAGAQKTYTNPQGAAFQPIQDTSAFATCP